MKITFEIPGQAQAKQRPRVMKNGITFTPKETINYENLIKWSYSANTNYQFQNAIDLNIVFYVQIPASTSKKKQEQMLAGQIQPTKKPDIDNLIKSIADGLNKIAYKDDNQIVSISARKVYAHCPKTVVEIKEIR